MSWSIRRATGADVARLGPFAASLFRQAYGPTHPEPTLSSYLADSFAEARTRRAVTDPDAGVLLVAADDGTWIGYAELREGSPTAPTTTLDAPLPGGTPLEVVRFYIADAWQGRGVAPALMRACEAEARARGCDVIWLQAWREAQQALRFYGKAGFGVHGSAVFTFGDRADADVILARSVG